MTNPMISVIMPVYNAEKYLEEAIKSILNQTYKNFEFIIINDGSTDKSLEIIEEDKIKDERIVLISRENRGLSISLNEGIEKAKGKYIARMDADDISLPNRFEEQVKFMEENRDIGISGTWSELFGDTIKKSILKPAIVHEMMKPRLLFSVCFVHPTVIIRKEVLDRHRLQYPTSYQHAEDYALWCKLSEVTRMANIPKVLLKYRYAHNSVSRIADNENESLRYQTLNTIYSKYLYQLNIINTEEENKLHYILTLGERIARAKINLEILNKYLTKLSNANEEYRVFDIKSLKVVLAKRFMAVLYHQFKKNNFSVFKALQYKYTYIGFFELIKERTFVSYKK